MRRTEQEFKEELLKRTKAYRQEQARKRKRMLGVGMCACLCFVALTVFDPFGASSEAPMAADNMMVGSALKSESAMLQDVGKDDLKLESNREYSFGDSSPAENAAAPMAPETNMSTTGDPSSAPWEEAEESAMLDVSVSISSAINTWPLKEADALVVQEYLSTEIWIEGATRCLMDCKIFVNGKTYEYSSRCGVLFDADAQQSLTLEEAERITLNEILKAYIPVEEAPAVTILRESGEILLNAADSVTITDCLLTGEWIPTAANCACDYALEISGEIYRYHSDCGTIQNESGQSLTIAETDKVIVNEILQKYGN